MATASISEPMMKSTESVIRLCATLVGSTCSSTTCPTMMSSGTVGSGIGSVMNSMVAMIDMTSTVWPSWVRPDGVGSAISRKPTIMVMKNHRRFHRKARSMSPMKARKRW